MHSKRSNSSAMRHEACSQAGLVKNKERGMKLAKVLWRPGVVLVLSFWSSIALSSGTNLITNGTFDSDLSGWTVNSPVSWISGEAHIGRPGTPGYSSLSQDFTSSSGNLLVSFDYEWEINVPTNVDTFTVEMSHNGQTETLLTETSDSFGGTFPGSQTVSTILNILNFNPSESFTILFSLNEVNEDVGTRIELDNVNVSVVPLPPAAILFASAITGVLLVARRRKSKQTDENSGVLAV
jgi:hypothetical protein